MGFIVDDRLNDFPDTPTVYTALMLKYTLYLSIHRLSFGNGRAALSAHRTRCVYYIVACIYSEVVYRSGKIIMIVFGRLFPSSAIGKSSWRIEQVPRLRWDNV